MGSAASISGGGDDCGRSWTQCRGGGGFQVSPGGNEFSMNVDRDGHFTASGGPYAAVSSRDTSFSSDKFVHKMCADAYAPITQHTHTGSIIASMAGDCLRGDTELTSMRHDASHFHSHTHDPISVGSVSIGSSFNANS